MTQRGEPPSATMLGTSNVYSQTKKPAARPPVTPARLAPGQYTAARMAGANWATAASDNVPIEASVGAFGVRWKKAYAINNTQTIATRRTQRIVTRDGTRCAADAIRRRHNIGSTRSLLIIVASATLATMTMPVAAA